MNTLLGDYQAHVAALKDRRKDEDLRRGQRAHRRADFVSGLTESYRTRATGARSKLIEEKASSMRSRKEFEILQQLQEITKWHQVMHENAVSRHATEQSNAEKQAEGEGSHLTALQQKELQSVQEALQGHDERWEALVEEQRREDTEHSTGVAKMMLQQAVRETLRVIDYCTANSIPRENARDLLPRSMLAHWLRESIPSGPSLIQQHVDMTLYTQRYNPKRFFPAAFTHIANKALAITNPAPSARRPRDPKSWPIVLVVGPKQSGKSTVAASVAEQLGFLHLSDMGLIDRAMEELNRDIDTDDLADPLVSELVDLGHEAQTLLVKGQPVSVSLISRLVIHALRSAPEDCRGVILDGAITTIEGIQSIEDALSTRPISTKEEITTQKQLLIAPASLPQEPDVDQRVAVLRPRGPSIEIAFPASREKTKDKGKRNKKEEEEPLPPVNLPPLADGYTLSEEETHILQVVDGPEDRLSIGKVISIECDPHAVFARLEGIRIDRETGEEYHLETNPPPNERIPFIDPPASTSQDSSQVHVSVQAFERRWKDARRWLEKYPDVLVTIPAGAPIEDIVEQCKSIVEETAQATQEHYMHVHEAERIKAAVEDVTKTQEEHNMARDAQKKQLLQLYMERGVDQIPSQLLEADWAPSDYVTLQPQLCGVLVDMINRFTGSYTDQVLGAHDDLQKTLTSFHAHHKACQVRFEHFWEVGDDRSDVLQQFIKTEMVMDKDFRFTEAGKNELHLRIDGVAETLHKIVEGRHEEASELLESLCAGTTALDQATDTVRYLGALLLQGEFDRFQLVRQVILTYFTGLISDPQPSDALEQASLEFLPLLKGQVDPLSESPQPQAKGNSKARATPTKKSGKPAPVVEETERSSEELLASIRSKATAAMAAQVDKLTIAAAPVEKNNKRKAVTEVFRVDSGAPGSLATPLVEEEVSATEARMQVISDFINTVVKQLQATTKLLKNTLTSSLQNHAVRQMSAVNGAIQYLRCQVEEEASKYFDIALCSECFAINETVALVDDDAQDEEEEEEADESTEVDLEPTTADEDHTPVISCLTFSRMSIILSMFKACHSNYLLHKDDFVRIVQQVDYTPQGLKTCSPSDLFDRFDTFGTGLMDWREFIVHLLFWCEPRLTAAQHDTAFNSRANPDYIEGPELLDLFDQRADLGPDPLDLDAFTEIGFFFEQNMNEERFECYRSVLWETFNEDGVINPDVLVLFLCADEQPLRGMHKAFAMATPCSVDDEPCALDAPLFDFVFHFSAANPRSLAVWDPYSQATQREVFDVCAVDELLFQDLCGTHIGRVLLNNAQCFRRKSFTQQVLSALML